MAGASMKDIKLRIKSVESTMQITKAMELVASSKLRRAKERVERSRPYFNLIHQTLTEIAYSTTEFNSDFILERPVKKACYIVIAGDRGLAGGYNNNMFKAVMAHISELTGDGREVCVLPIGKKAVEFFDRRKIEILSRDYMIAEDVSIRNCFEIAGLIAEEFRSRRIDAVYLGYTNFVSMLTQEPAVIRMLPLKYNRSEAKEPTGPKALTIYEPSCEAVYDAMVPEYMSGMIYGGLCESVASELGARRTAMDAASKNAGEMIEDLSLRYNRARQGAITQEITEIVAGAEA